MKREKVILHIIKEEEWNRVKHSNFYHPDSLKKEGFIHCATKEQLMRAVEFVYKEPIKQKVLYIDAEKVKPEIVYEDVHNTGEVFPHIYGALNLDAVNKVVDFSPNEAGAFELPAV